MLNQVISARRYNPAGSQKEIDKAQAYKIVSENAHEIASKLTHRDKLKIIDYIYESGMITNRAWQYLRAVQIVQNDSRFVSKGKAAVAKKMGRSVRTVDRAQNECEALGYVEITRDLGWQSENTVNLLVYEHMLTHKCDTLSYRYIRDLINLIDLNNNIININSSNKSLLNNSYEEYEEELKSDTQIKNESTDSRIKSDLKPLDLDYRSKQTATSIIRRLKLSRERVLSSVSTTIAQKENYAAKGNTGGFVTGAYFVAVLKNSASEKQSFIHSSKSNMSASMREFKHQETNDGVSMPTSVKESLRKMGLLKSIN